MKKANIYTLFETYPDAMSLEQFADALNVSTNLASKILRKGDVYSVMIGREYRIAKTAVIDYLTGANQPSRKNNCVESVTSNPEDWTCQDKCGIVCDTENEKEMSL